VARQAGDRRLFVPGRAALRTFLPTSLALGLLAFFLWRAIDAFGPGSWINDVDFNSDSAIPVLMSNEARPLSIFNFYYYGADRWGGWPFLVTRFIGRVTGRHWTDQGVFTVQAFWIFIGALICAGLTSDDYLVVILAYVIALCLHSEARYLMFELSQVYAWQTTAVLLAWYGLRRLFDREGEPGYPRRRYLLILSATICFSYLAIWSSVASIVLLLFLVAVEWVRACVGRSEAVLRPCVLGGTAVLAAAGLEFLQKTMYRRYVRTVFGNDWMQFVTHFRLDSGHLLENLGVHLHYIGRLAWWPFYVLSILALLTLIGGFVHGWINTSDRPSKTRRPVLADDTAILIVGASGIAAINFVLAAVIDHVRMHGYDQRYLTLTDLFGPFSAFLVVWLIIKTAVRSSRLRPLVHVTLIVVSTGLLASHFPTRRYSPQYEQLKQTARALALKAPGRVLMGGYWDTYVLTALQSDNAMTPVPVYGEITRTPWTQDLVRRSDWVIVAFRRASAASSPPQFLEQFGAKLQLADPSWHSDRLHLFAKYENITRQ
jgi:hypothetical protein